MATVASDISWERLAIKDVQVREHDLTAIEKVYRFGDFRAALAFVNRVGELAERQQHHPDIAIHYSEVTLRLWSHDRGGVTLRDVKLAEAIDA